MIDDAAPLVRDALDIAAAHPDNARSRLYAHYMAGANHWAAGRISPAGQHLAEARRAWEEIAPRRGDRQTWATSISLPLNVAGVSAITAALAGDGALVAELIGQLDELAAVLDAPATSISAGLFTALALAIHGDVAGARRGAVRATEASARDPRRPPLAGGRRHRGVEPPGGGVGRPPWPTPPPPWTRSTPARPASPPPCCAACWPSSGGGRATPTARRRTCSGPGADVDERGERFWLPELLRLQAELPATEDPTGPPRRGGAVADAQGEPPFAARARAARERVAG